MIAEALARPRSKPLVIDYRDLECGVEGDARLGTLDYEEFIAGGRPRLRLVDARRRMECDLAQLHQRHDRQPQGRRLYTRGAALMCYANTIATSMGQHPVYLWTLPMFHCNGWCFPWTLSLVWPAPMSACARCGRSRYTTPSPITR